MKALAHDIVVSTIVHCILFVEINTFEFGASSSTTAILNKYYVNEN